jgi:hypothetical protein
MYLPDFNCVVLFQTLLENAEAAGIRAGGGGDGGHLEATVDAKVVRIGNEAVTNPGGPVATDVEADAPVDGADGASKPDA